MTSTNPGLGRKSHPPVWPAYVVGLLLPAALAFAGGGYGTVARTVAAVAAWWGLGLLVAFDLVPRGRPSPRARWIAIAFAALLGWMALTAAWTESLERTIDEASMALGYAGILALAVLALDRRTWRAAAGGLATAALLVVAAALANRLVPGAFAETVVQEVFGHERLSFPLDYWNAVGCWASMTFPMLLAWSLESRRGWVRVAALGSLPAVGVVAYLSFSRGTLLSALAGLLVLGLLMPRSARPALLRVTAVALAGSVVAILVVRSVPAIALGEGGEGGWIVALALVLLAAASAPLALEGGPRGRGGALAPALALPVAAMMIGLAMAAIGGPDATREPTPVAPRDAQTPPPGDAREVLGDVAGEEPVDPAARLATAGGLRDELWPSALRAARDNPVGGIGAGAFDIWWAGDSQSGAFARNAHSIYLEFAAELGIVGLAILLVLLAAIGRAALASQRAGRGAEDGLGVLGAGLIAAAAVWAVQAGVDWMWESAALVALAIGCVGCVVAARTEPGRRHRMRGGARATVVLVCAVAGAVHLPGALGAERHDAALEAVYQDELALAEERLDQSLAVRPWSADSHALRSLVRFGRDDVDGALEDARTAVRRVPNLYRHWLALAQIEALEGDRREAERALERAAELRPAEADALRELGVEAFRVID